MDDLMVTFMDGEVKAYTKVKATTEDGCLVLRVEKYWDSPLSTKFILPLHNIRQVEYT